MHNPAVRLVVVALILGCIQTRADPCSDIKLPEQVQEKLSTAYAGWKIMTPALLPDYDRSGWRECCAKECPGLIQGKFTDEAQGYAVNLVRKTRAKTFQQIVYFRPAKTGFDVVTIGPSSAVDVVSVIRKGPPGRYRDHYTGKAIKTDRDVVIVSEIDAGAVAYYWDGTRFRFVHTSI
jgi:hypothetical protein